MHTDKSTGTDNIQIQMTTHNQTQALIHTWTHILTQTNTNIDTYLSPSQF